MASIKIPNSLISNILSRTNIVELINQRIQLKKSGKNFYAYCPFHQEKHPSFSVSYEKQFYYCFSCRAHGNAIDFLIHYEHLEFIESIKELASMNGISLTLEAGNHKNKLYEIMDNLNIFYQKNLTKKTAIQARKYLTKRGLNNNIIKHFNIGFAPNYWQNIKNIYFNNEISKNDKKLLKKTGMLITNNQGYTYDRFRERIIFPIRNKHGQVIAFGGRTLKEEKPKYLNSPDTDIFQKRHYLYGLYELRKIHRYPPYIILVEGYMDVVSLAQFEIYNVVASLGTSTTKTHIQSLYYNTDQIICCYDGDHSGYVAAWRTLQTTLPFLTDTRTLAFIFLPKQEDPDTLIHKIGKEKFLKYIENAKPLSKFLFNTLLKKIDIKTIEGKSKLGSLALSIINKIPGNILRIQLHQELGKKIGILDTNKLTNLLTKKITYKKKHSSTLIKNTATNIIIALLIQQPTLYKLILPQKHKLKESKQTNIPILIELIKFYQIYPNATQGQILEFYRTKKFYKEIKSFTLWDHMIPHHMIPKIFTDALIQLHNSLLKEQQEQLIATARINQLTKQQREELWVINKKLAKINNQKI